MVTYGFQLIDDTVGRAENGDNISSFEFGTSDHTLSGLDISAA
jgi:hypothetical protein